MENLKELVSKIHLAKNYLLNPKIEFQRNKKFIKVLFKMQPNSIITKEEIIRNRLIVIDNLYSTNLKKRYLGIDDLVNFFNKDEKQILANFQGCLDVFVEGVFPNNIGCDSNGNDSGSANSLITKYVYYLSNYNYPIFDSLARKSYFSISNRYNEIVKYTEYKLNDISCFLKAITELKKIINKLDTSITFSDIDNFLWLYGKLNNSHSTTSYSLLGKDKIDYQQLSSKNYSKELSEFKAYIENGY